MTGFGEVEVASSGVGGAGRRRHAGDPARSFGIDAERVDDPAQLDWRPGARVLVVPGDRDANVELHDRIHAEVARAVEA